VFYVPAPVLEDLFWCLWVSFGDIQL